MLDFTSALYLGLKHGSASLVPWARLTSGRPAVLETSYAEREVAQRLAALQGLERGVLGPSSFHLFWDLFGILGKERIIVYMDSALYPLGQWGVERVRCRGRLVRRFPKGDIDALHELLRSDERLKLRPLIVTDSLKPGLWGPLPLNKYLELVREYRGWLVIDDTQGLGVLGKTPNTASPLGKGGGGTLQWYGIRRSNVITICSLAKGFGVPVAVLAGSEQFIEQFTGHSETRMFASPPSSVDVHAAMHALLVNQVMGDMIRSKLTRLVRRFCTGLASVGVITAGGPFPVQTVWPGASTNPLMFNRKLLSLGIRTVLQKSENKTAKPTFIITARHQEPDIDSAVEMVQRALCSKAYYQGCRTYQ